MSFYVCEKTRNWPSLRLIGRLDGAAENDSVGDGNVSLKSANGLRPTLAAMTHLGVSDGNHSLVSHAITNAQSTSIWVWLEVLPHDST